MYNTLGCIDQHNRLNEHNISVELTDVPMSKIETVIKDLEYLMMNEYEFCQLATTPQESGLVGGQSSSSSSDESENDADSSSNYDPKNDLDCKPRHLKTNAKQDKV